MLLCVGCGVGQGERNADQPFLHVDGCRLASGFAKHPWIELRALLTDLPPVQALAQCHP